MGFLNQTDPGPGGQYGNPLVWRLVMRFAAIPLACILFAIWEPIRDGWNGHFAKCVKVLPPARLAELTGTPEWSRTYIYSGDYSCSVTWADGGKRTVSVDLDRGYGTEGTVQVWREGLRAEHAVPEVAATAWEGLDERGDRVLVVSRTSGAVRVKTGAGVLDDGRRVQLYGDLRGQLFAIDDWFASK